MRYQSKRLRRQFLAGVKCPQCQSLDSIVQIRQFEPVADEYIECIHCGHTQRRPDAAEFTDNHLATPAKLGTETDVNANNPTSSEGIIRFID